MMSQRAPPPYTEAYPPTVLFLLSVLAIAAVQLSDGISRHVVGQARTRAANIRPVSFTSISRSCSAVVRSISLSSEASLLGTLVWVMCVACLILTAFDSKAFGDMAGICINPQSVLPPIVNLKTGGLDSLWGMKDVVRRILLHPLIAVTHSQLSFASAFYWGVTLPGCFFVVTSLIEGTFVGGERNPCRVWSCAFAALMLTTIGTLAWQLFAETPNTIVLLGRNVGQTCARGMEAILFAMGVYAFWLNPVVHTDLMEGTMARLPFPIEARWPMCAMLFVVVAETYWWELGQKLIAGTAAGVILIARSWVMENHDFGNLAWKYLNGSVSQMIFQGFVSMTGMCLLPLSALSLPKWKELLGLLAEPLDLDRWRAALHPSPSMWEILCSMDATPRVLAKGSVFFVPLLPFVSKCARKNVCTVLACLTMLQLVYAMNSPAWRYPHLGFAMVVWGLYRYTKLAIKSQ